MTLDDIKRRINRDVYDRPLAAILTYIVEMIGDKLVTAQGLVLEAEARAQAVVDRMEAALSAPETGAGVPEGWRLVPVEPTDKMIWEGGSALHDRGEDTTGIYRAMLSAAPPVPAGGEGATRDERTGWPPMRPMEEAAAIRDAALEEAANLADKLRHPDGYSSETEDWCEGTRHAARAIRALRSSPAPETVGEEELATFLHEIRLASYRENKIHGNSCDARALLRDFTITRKPKTGG